MPRRYRGRDVMAWLWDCGFLDVARDDLADPRITRAAQPQVSGIGRYGHTLSLQKLARDGVQLLGRVLDADAGSLTLGDDLHGNIRFADQRSADIKREIDAYITRYGIDAQAVEPDAADQPWTDFGEMNAPNRLDLAAAGIETIIWCTGFAPDFPWLHVPVLDEVGGPMHDGGETSSQGLFFIGFPWLHKRKSGIICGVEEDAAYIARRIAGQLALAA